MTKAIARAAAILAVGIFVAHMQPDCSEFSVTPQLCIGVSK